MALRGWARLAWQADYGQFYLIDREDTDFLPPQDFTPEMASRRFFVPDHGLVVYTNDCLQQQISIEIHDTEPQHPPEEWMSGNRWTQIETTRLSFPSRRFSISSPSSPDPLPNGPVFALDATIVMARISWMEFEGSRDDSVPVQPDVIAITFWPE